MQRETADLAGVAFGRIRIGWDHLQRVQAVGIGQLSQLRKGGRAGAMQARFALWLLDVLIRAVEPQHMKVDIEVERAVEALDQRYRAALRVVSAVNDEMDHRHRRAQRPPRAS